MLSAKIYNSPISKLEASCKNASLTDFTGYPPVVDAQSSSWFVYFCHVLYISPLQLQCVVMRSKIDNYYVITFIMSDHIKLWNYVIKKCNVELCYQITIYVL